MPYPLFCYDDDVPCVVCDAVMGKARDASRVEPELAHGNRQMRCKSCGWTTVFDVTRSTAQRDHHNAKIAAYRKAVRENLRALAQKGELLGVRLPAQPKQRPAPQKIAGKVTHLEGSPFNLAPLINQELKP